MSVDMSGSPPDVPTLQKDVADNLCMMAEDATNTCSRVRRIISNPRTELQCRRLDSAAHNYTFDSRRTLSVNSPYCSVDSLDLDPTQRMT